jgi:hypothetical protein
VGHLSIQDLGLAALPPYEPKPSAVSEYLRRQVEAKRAKQEAERAAAVARAAALAQAQARAPVEPEERPIVKVLAVVGAVSAAAWIGRKMRWL